MENSNKKINISKKNFTVYIILFLFILGYFFFWRETAKQYKLIIKNFVEQNENLKYENLKLSGFPFSIKLDFYNLEYADSQVGFSTEIKIPYLSFKNFILTKKFFLDLDRVELKTDQEIANIELDKNKEIYFVVEKQENSEKLLFSNIFFDIDKIIITSSSDADKKTEINSLLFKTNTIKNNEYINFASILDIEKAILTYKNNNGQQKTTERNIFVNFSIAEDLLNNEVETYTFDIQEASINDITNKFSISLNGKYKTHLKNYTNSLDFEVKIKNFINLVNSGNSENNIVLNNLAQTILLLPENSKNNELDKFVKIEKKETDNAISINGQNIQEIITKLLPQQF